MKKLLIVFSLLISSYALAQNASVAPTRIYFNNDLGESRVKTVYVMNKSNEAQSYQVSFLDFEVNNTKGKPTLMKANKSKYSISPWVSASPSYFTIQPGQSQEIKVRMDTPNTPEANSVKWGAMSVKLAKEQGGPLDDQKNQLGMAIVNTFQIVVYLFQTPPSITERNAEIYDFKVSNNEGVFNVLLASKNTSPSILDCRTYIEITNTSTGWSHKTQKKRFTLLPEGAKEMYFQLPADLPKGQYSIMGVVDYGNSSEIKAAEIELEIE